MSLTTTNAPFGTDNTPAVEIRIIGGKRVEVPARTPSDQWNGKSPPHGPHGTPSILTQPAFRAYEVDGDLQHGYTTAKQHHLARKVNSYTSPVGDRSQSFQHGLPAINKHPVLPPIGFPKTIACSGPGIRHSETSWGGYDISGGEFERRPKENEEPLEVTVARQLRHYDVLKIKNMYIELTSYDRRLTGFVDESQLCLIALRYNLPLPLSTLKRLIFKFSDERDEKRVNYEKFLQYISSCCESDSSSPGKHRNRNNEHSADHLPRSPIKAADASPAAQQQRGGDGHNASSPSSSADVKLVSLLRQQLKNDEDFVVADLRAALARADSRRDGKLPAETIQRVCVLQRVPLTQSLVTKMLRHAEISHGIVDWHEFLNPLLVAGGGQPTEKRPTEPRRDSPDRSRAALSNASPGKEGSPFRQQGLSPNRRQGLSPNRHRAEPPSPDHRRHHRASDHPFHAHDATMTSSDRSSHITRSDVTLPGSRHDRSTAADSKEWHDAERTERPPHHQQPAAGGTKRGENWNKNFTRLENALRTYHPDRRDRLSRDDARRTVANYNLVFKLDLAADDIDRALDRSTTSGGEISVDRLLTSLERAVLE